MSPSTLKLLSIGALLVHGLGHGGALAALIWIARRPGNETGGWRAARSWLLPSLSPSVATTVASAFWIVSMIAFVVVALSYWGVMLASAPWRSLAVASAIVSTVGIVLFLGTWPVFNTVAALAMNAAVLGLLLVAHWPPAQMLPR